METPSCLLVRIYVSLYTADKHRSTQEQTNMSVDSEANQHLGL